MNNNPFQREKDDFGMGVPNPPKEERKKEEVGTQERMVGIPRTILTKLGLNRKELMESIMRDGDYRTEYIGLSDDEIKPMQVQGINVEYGIKPPTILNKNIDADEDKSKIGFFGTLFRLIPFVPLGYVIGRFLWRA